jgi:hypothetical protein
MNHYERLGVSRNATPAEIREAYRQAARAAHPDRHGVASSERMARVNEAWRVLGDPQRRSAYDDLLTATGADTMRSATGSAQGGASSSSRTNDHRAPTHPSPVATVAPARFPWRFLLSMAIVGVVAVLVGSALTEPGEPGVPDGILRTGDCVVIGLDADEVSCAGPHDAVVEALIPFDQTCPVDTEAVRDRQGMGTACVVRLAAGRQQPTTLG